MFTRPGITVIASFQCGVAELGLVHRHELSGALHGLMRVRSFTQDDAHIFMLPSQIKDEIMGVMDLFNVVYSTFGLSYHAELSTKPEKGNGVGRSLGSCHFGAKAGIGRAWHAISDQ